MIDAKGKIWFNTAHAAMAELVDALALGASTFGRESSSLSRGTVQKNTYIGCFLLFAL